MHYAELIKDIIILSGYKSFLELGVWTGVCSKAVAPYVDTLVGVDVIDRRDDKTLGQFYEMTTDEYFANHKNGPMFDVIFIDAEHSFKAVERDLHNSLQHLNKNGLIIIHDTDPSEPQYYDACSDVWKIIPEIHHINSCVRYPQLEILTLPIQVAGMTFVKRVTEHRREHK